MSEFKHLLEWQDGRIRKFAQRILDNGEYNLLPILSDLLEEAGCTDEAVIGHGRIGMPIWHTPGCGLLQFLLSTDKAMQEQKLEFLRAHFAKWKETGEI